MQILQTGTFHAEEVEFAESGTWWCLWEVDREFELETCQVEVSETYNVLREDDSGTKVVVAGGDPLLLLRGLELTPGPVDTCFSGRHSFLEGLYGSGGVDGGVEVTLVDCPEGSGKSIDMHAEGTLAGRFGAPIVHDLSLSIGWGAGRDRIPVGRVGADALPSLLWAGDLDRDGQADFFLDLSVHYNCMEYGLRLSSVGKRDIARLRSCGC